MDRKKIADLVSIAKSGDLSRKVAFHRLGQQYLKCIAELMELPQGTFSVRSCKGGPGVMGEVILHADNLYVCLTTTSFDEDTKRFYYRTCKGQKDYTGGRNTWMSWSALEDPYEVSKRFKAHVHHNAHEYAY